MSAVDSSTGPPPTCDAAFPGASGVALSRREAALRWLLLQFLRLMMFAYAVLMRLAQWFGPKKPALPAEPLEVLMTGTFHSDNWLLAHLRPLAASRRCRRVRMVASAPVPAMDKVEPIYPPVWLTRLIGRVPARLVTFAWVAINTRPQVIGGFHLLFNGLLAALLARFLGARALYICGGGPWEVLGGGVWSENRVCQKLKRPDAGLERQFLEAVRGFDFVITMGSGAITFFRQRGIDVSFRLISGGLDTVRFRPGEEPPTIDLIVVARLAPIKRLDLFLEAVKLIREQQRAVSSVIVGDGESRAALEQLAGDLGIAGDVRFAGLQKDTASWLRKAKVFVLTSDAEGLSLALMEAMMCGLPGVVSEVGDLPDLVQNGVNGYLVRERTAEAFADRLMDLLREPERRERFAREARHSAQRYSVAAASQEWDQVFLPPA
jgi:glycosyltransferase involved in cell wall biosynthesis